MSTITITVTERDGELATTLDRDLGMTPQEVLTLIGHGMVDTVASVMLADKQMGTTLRTIEPDPGKTVEATARSLARGMAVRALTDELPRLLAREELDR